MRLRTQVSLMCAATLFASACSTQTPPSPAVRAFGDNRHWITVEPMEYIIGRTTARIIVPQGFVTDFASIPQPLWAVGLAPHGQYSRAAIIHDFLYWSQSCTRTQSDRLMLIAMKESDVGGFDEFTVYQGVNRGGQSAWDQNAANRKAGMFRVLPDKYSRPADPNINWPTYHEAIRRLGVTDPVFPSNPPFCAYGDSTEVP